MLLYIDTIILVACVLEFVIALLTSHNRLADYRTLAKDGGIEWYHLAVCRNSNRPIILLTLFFPAHIRACQRGSHCSKTRLCEIGMSPMNATTRGKGSWLVYMPKHLPPVRTPKHSGMGDAGF